MEAVELQSLRQALEEHPCTAGLTADGSWRRFSERVRDLYGHPYLPGGTMVWCKTCGSVLIRPEQLEATPLDDAASENGHVPAGHLAGLASD